MPALRLTTAIATYGHTRPLKDGTLLFTLFKAAKEHYLGQLDVSSPLAQPDTSMQEMRQIIGQDPFLYGIAPNWKTFEAFIRFNVEQQVIPHQLEVEEIFPPCVHALA